MSKKARRGRGEGAVFFSKAENTWITRVSINGKRTTIRRKKKESVQCELVNLKSKAHQGLLGKKGDRSNTVEQIVRKYVNDRVDEGKISASTAHRYEGIISKKISPTLGSIPVADLTRDHLKKFFATQRESKNVPATILKTYNLLRVALAEAVDDELLTESPCTKNFRPAVKTQDVQAFTQEQHKALLAYAQRTNHRDFRLLTVAFWTGLRSGELLALQWSDIDLKLGLLTVNHSLTNFGNEKTRRLKAPKNGKSRPVPLSTDALEALKEQREYLMSQGHPRPLVFPNNDGKPMNGKHFLRRLKKLCKNAEVPILDVHATRHTFASMALQGGMDYKTLSVIMGHYSVAFTIDRYAKLAPDAQRIGIEKLEAFLNRSAS